MREVVRVEEKIKDTLGAPGEPKASRPDRTMLESMKISVEQVREMLSQLAFLLQSGIPLFTSLSLVGQNLRDATMKKVITQVRFDLSEGVPLSTCLKKYPYVFDPVQINMILIGESSGRLDESLVDLVKMIDDQRELRDEVRKALAYPIFLVVVSSVLCLGMLLYIFPRFKGVFANFEENLPAITSLFMGTSAFLLDHIWAVFFLLGLIPVSIFVVLNVRSARYVWDKYRYRIPIFGDIFQGQMLASFGQTLSTLLSTGIPLVQTMQLYLDTIDNLYLKERIGMVISQVKEGATLSTALGSCELFTPLSIQLIYTGENIGELDKMANKVFIFYRKRLSRQIKRLVTVLEPAFLAVMGSMVALMAISILLPLFKLAGGVRGR
ncbi:type II secretion system F family protein [Bdellovibrionota bacterium]